MEDSVVATRALTKSFGNKRALTNFSLQIPRGGTHAIVGSNGAGKSTLFRLILGLLTPTAGTATLLGECSAKLSPETRGRVGYVNEEHTLPNWMTADQVTRFQKSFYPGWNEAIYRRVIGNFDVLPKQRVASLSRGERAGLNLAVALAQAPDLLILDEPTLGMDVVAKRAFLEALMFSAGDQETTIIYCSHQMEEIERVADTLIIMEKGELKNFSTPEAFCDRISYWIAGFQGPFPGGDLPGLLGVKEIEDQFHITAVDQGDDFQLELECRGAVMTQKCPLSLDLAVNAFLAKNHDAPKRQA